MARISVGKRAWTAVAGVACGLALLAGCGGSSTETEPEGTFLVEVQGERFRVRATEPAVAANLRARHRSGEVNVVLGEVRQGDGGFNAPWSWHLDPATVQVPDAAMELCDARPSTVQRDVAKWIAEVGIFCPWSARVVRVP